MERLLIMAGGTGGHVYPALAVAKELQACGYEVVWMGTHAGLEARVVPEAGIEIAYVSVSGLRGNGLKGWLLAPFRLLRALQQSAAILRKYRPACVLGMGGFVSGPGGVAARLLRRPLVIHDQNAIAGLTNKLLSRIADQVLEAFPDTFPPQIGAEYVGNPVRKSLLNVPSVAQQIASRESGLSSAMPLRLLVLGGSLGAFALNKLVPAVLAQFSSETRPQVWHQVGPKHLETTQEFYRERGLEIDLELEDDSIRVVHYIEEMEAAYAWADLVVCRAGAMTISELAMVGRGAILVPFPYAVDDHQTANGNFLAERGAAILIQQKDLDAEKLAALLREFSMQPEKLIEMGEKAKKLAKPEATAMVVEACLEEAGVAGVKI